MPCGRATTGVFFNAWDVAVLTDIVAADSCSTACERDPQCELWTWAPEHVPFAGCWLKRFSSPRAVAAPERADALSAYISGCSERGVAAWPTACCASTHVEEASPPPVRNMYARGHRRTRANACADAQVQRVPPKRITCERSSGAPVTFTAITYASS